jgi:hypothetical protein
VKATTKQGLIGLAVLIILDVTIALITRSTTAFVAAGIAYSAAWTTAFIVMTFIPWESGDD